MLPTLAAMKVPFEIGTKGKLNENVGTFVLCHDLRSCKMAKLLTLLLKIIKQQKLNFVNLKIA